MRTLGSLRKDHISAALLVALGGAITVIGYGYPVGTLVNMGPAFFPLVLGTLMVVVGITIGCLAWAQTPEEEREQAVPPLPDLRGVLCILFALGLFIALANYGGLVPATFVSVIVAAMGDRENTWKTAITLALIMVVFGTAIFHYALGIQLPLFAWNY